MRVSVQKGRTGHSEKRRDEELLQTAGSGKDALVDEEAPAPWSSKVRSLKANAGLGGRRRARSGSSVETQFTRGQEVGGEDGQKGKG